MLSTTAPAAHSPAHARTAPPVAPLIVSRCGELASQYTAGTELRPLITARDCGGEAEAAELLLPPATRVVLAPEGCDLLAYGLDGTAGLAGHATERAVLTAHASLRIPAGARAELHGGETGARLVLMTYGAGLAPAVQTPEHAPSAGAGGPAAQFIPAGHGEMLGVVNDLVRIVVSGSQTQRRYFQGAVTERPGGGPPPHTHREAELFYVVEGDFRFWTLGPDGPLEFPAGPGDAVLVGHGQPHTFSLAQPRSGTVLVLTWDSGLEDMFRAIGAPVADPAQFLAATLPPPTPEQIGQLVEAVGRFGMQVLTS